VRVIGGEFKGRHIQVSKSLPVRPTTDFAREGLFNVLDNQIEFEGLKILDLFSGTGMISLEFISRGVENVLSIDIHPNCVNHIRNTASIFSKKWLVQKRNVFHFVKSSKLNFDIVFADPPYDLKNIVEIPSLVFNNKTLLNQNGILIVEHSKRTDLSKQINFVETRKYGNVNFSFFKPKPHE
jgi:16S rRNA (guanine(966)-N(2))-methyltransferase RsmD